MNDGGAFPEHPQPLPASLVLRFRSLIEERAGVVVDDRKDEALAEAVAEVARRFQHATPEDVLTACSASHGQGSAFQALAGRITIGETHFFRNRPHFEALSEVVFPEILEKRRNSRRVRVWSAGCSSGEETWSLAMTLAATAERMNIDLRGWDVTILGTDLDAEALDRARKAEYGRYSFRGVEDAEIARFFDQTGDSYRVLARYRSLVDFRAFNLKLDVFPASGTPFSGVDLIVCRNVTIYFSQETTKQVVEGFFETLDEGGYLLVGHSEHSLETYSRFQTRALPDVILYQRGGDRVERPVVAAGAAPTFFPTQLRRTLAPAFMLRSRRLGTLDVPVMGEAAPLRRSQPSPLDLARAALADGDPNRAANVAVAVLENDHSNAEAALLLGQIAADRGHFREAEIWLRRTLEVRPLDLAAHYLSALLALERGEKGAALRCLERALYVDPGFVMALHLQGRLLRELGQPDAAERSLRAARIVLEKLPDDLEVPYSEGLSVAQLRTLVGGAAR